MSGRGLGFGAAVALGAAVTVLVGPVGAVAWLAWIWANTADDVRASIAHSTKVTVIAVIVVSLSAALLGLLATIAGLVRAFHAVGETAASEKAAVLTDAIDRAMLGTVVGLTLTPVAIVVSWVAGIRLLRVSRAPG